MRPRRLLPRAARTAVTLLAMSGAAYAAYVVTAWLRYGNPSAARDDEADALLDLFIPRYDVVERHRIDVAAPSEMTFDALMGLNLNDSRVIRAIFKGRERLLGAEPDRTQPQSLVEMTKSLGWVVLAEVPGHEIVMGAVTRPWEANVVFRGIPSEHFAAFDEPDYVKIVWTLRADAAGSNRSIALTETRAIATDTSARRKFRWYWARFSPGIILIRSIAQRLVKREAERARTEEAARGLTSHAHPAGREQ
jgi:hypothetical protein